MSWLEKIRQKPENQKMKIMWAAASVVFVFLVLVWIISYRFHQKTAVDKTLFNAMGQGIKDVQENYKK